MSATRITHQSIEYVPTTRIRLRWVCLALVILLCVVLHLVKERLVLQNIGVNHKAISAEHTSLSAMLYDIVGALKARRNTSSQDAQGILIAKIDLFLMDLAAERDLFATQAQSPEKARALVGFMRLDYKSAYQDISLSEARRANEVLWEAAQRMRYFLTELQEQVGKPYFTDEASGVLMRLKSVRRAVEVDSTAVPITACLQVAAYIVLATLLYLMVPVRNFNGEVTSEVRKIQKEALKLIKHYRRYTIEAMRDRNDDLQPHYQYLVDELNKLKLQSEYLLKRQKSPNEIASRILTSSQGKEHQVVSELLKQYVLPLIDDIGSLKFQFRQTKQEIGRINGKKK